jgi:hypothetical protein
LEARDSHHYGWAEDYTAYDFCDHSGLAELREGVMEQATEDNDDASLLKA